MNDEQRQAVQDMIDLAREALSEWSDADYHLHVYPELRESVRVRNRRRHDYKERIRALEARIFDTMQWTPIEEQLPRPNDYYLICYAEEGKEEIDIAYLDNMGCWRLNNSSDYVIPSHWMRLPPLPALMDAPASHRTGDGIGTNPPMTCPVCQTVYTSAACPNWH